MKITAYWIYCSLALQVLLTFIGVMICVNRATRTINEHTTRRTAMVLQNLRESDVQRNRRLNDIEFSLILLENAILKKEGEGDAARPTE